MKLLGHKVRHPGIALIVYFLIGAILAKYGVVNGTALIFCMFMGMAIYRIIVQAESS